MKTERQILLELLQLHNVYSLSDNPDRRALAVELRRIMELELIGNNEGPIRWSGWIMGIDMGKPGDDRTVYAFRRTAGFTPIKVQPDQDSYRIWYTRDHKFNHNVNWPGPTAAAAGPAPGDDRTYAVRQLSSLGYKCHCGRCRPKAKPMPAHLHRRYAWIEEAFKARTAMAARRAPYQSRFVLWE